MIKDFEGQKNITKNLLKEETLWLKKDQNIICIEAMERSISCCLHTQLLDNLTKLSNNKLVVQIVFRNILYRRMISLG